MSMITLPARLFAARPSTAYCAALFLARRRAAAESADPTPPFWLRAGVEDRPEGPVPHLTLANGGRNPGWPRPA